MVTLVDSSIWVNYFRHPGDGANEPMRELIRTESLAITDPITMELLMGPTDELAVRRVEHAISAATVLTVTSDLDWRHAAEIYRAVRRAGRTVRSKIDCLIAAIAIRHDVELLHADRDFEVIAALTGLRHRSLR